MKKSAEKRTANAILQEARTVEVAGVTYEVAPPTAATLIRISEMVSEMPEIDGTSEDEISEVMLHGKDCKKVGEIIATCILGEPQRRTLSYKREHKTLSRNVLFAFSPSELSSLFSDLIVNRMEVGFFFQLITSLSAANLIKPTKTIASGQ